MFFLLKYAPAWARAACLAVLICAAFGATAYAVYQSVVWEATEGTVDTGARFVLIPDKDYIPVDNNTTVLIGILTIYEKNITVPLSVLDEDTANTVRDQLKGQVFTSDGEHFELLAQVESGYQADDRGFTLYDSGGEEIIKIGLAIVDNDGFESKLVTIWNTTAYEQPPSVTYDEAAAFLGSDFRLPTANTEHLDPPVFHILRPVSVVQMQISYYNESVQVNLFGGNPSIVYYVFPNRGDSDIASHINVPGDIVFEGMLADVTVYKFAYPNSNLFMWEFEGLTYAIDHYTWASGDFSFGSFSDEKIEEIIRSMIE